MHGTTVTGPDGAQHIQPALPAHAYTTFQVASPQRPATCEEYGCPGWLNGWALRAESLTPDLLHLARNSGRRYREQHVAEGETWLIFEPGQACFAASAHRLPWDGRERFTERGGDWRGNPRGDVREFTRADDWLDRFATHQDRLTTALGRG